MTTRDPELVLKYEYRVFMTCLPAGLCFESLPCFAIGAVPDIAKIVFLL